MISSNRRIGKKGKKGKKWMSIEKDICQQSGHSMSG